MKASLPLAALAACLSSCSAQQVIDLSGSGWTLQNSNKSISIPARVPSQAYIDLYDHKVIGDPLFGFNDVNEAWVQRSNWTYTSKPLRELPWGQLAEVESKIDWRTWLVFEGLDTFTHITMCGKEVGKTDNMFRQYTFDVTDILISCKEVPKLSINFGSATKITHAISETISDPTGLNYINSCRPDNEFGCKIYSRKEQNDMGWDWSPSLSPAGPWRPISAVQLNRVKPVYINNALIDIYRKGQMNNLPPDQSQPWVFNASLDFIGKLPKHAGLQLTLKDANNREVLRTALNKVYSSNGTITGSTTIDQSKVQLWWPNGMGDQNLYKATVQIVENGVLPLAQVERRVGFRTIVLNLGPITDKQLAAGVAPGANWHFEINGHEMYAKGSNFVPPDAFWARVNETKIRNLFELVTEANMNMLRVWASGAYLDDWIYDLADEMGILLWSEFEFTDAEYSTVSSYLANYEAEAYYNVRRVNHHPSLALWAGGNELEAIQLAFFFNPDSPSPVMQQYQQIFEELLIKCVYANTKSISYIPSSTYNGYLKLDFDSVRPQLPRYKNRTSPDALYTDTDYYNYDSDIAFDLSKYPVGRFANEFGFISMPSIETWKEAAAPDQLYVESPTVVHHNRHTPFGASGDPEQLQRAGLDEMTSAVPKWYPAPNLANSEANFTAWIYSTQLFQADYYQHQIAFYRRGSGLPERQLGSLYWQLEDLWAAPTWSSIESTGRQKLLYYAAKDIYQPVIVYAYYNVTTYELQAWVTSDLWNSVSGTVSYEWVDWNGKPLSLTSNSTTKAPGSKGSVPFTVGALNSTQVLRYDDVHAALSSHNQSASNAILRLSVTAHAADNKDKTYKHSYFFHPTTLNNTTIPDPGLKLTRGGSSGKTVSFTVTANKATAAWVWLDYQTNAVKGYWSENGFWLMKGESRTVTFSVQEDWSAGAWVKTVGVRSLYDNTLS